MEASSRPGLGASCFDMPSLDYRRGLHAGWEVAVRAVPQDDYTLVSASGSLVIDWPRSDAPVALMFRLGLGLSAVDDEAAFGPVCGGGVRILVPAAMYMVSVTYYRATFWGDTSTSGEDPSWLSIMVCLYVP